MDKILKREGQEGQGGQGAILTSMDAFREAGVAIEGICPDPPPPEPPGMEEIVRELGRISREMVDNIREAHKGNCDVPGCELDKELEVLYSVLDIADKLFGLRDLSIPRTLYTLVGTITIYKGNWELVNMLMSRMTALMPREKGEE